MSCHNSDKYFLSIVSFFLLFTSFTACKKSSIGEGSIGEKKDSMKAPLITALLKPITFPVNNIVGGYYIVQPSNYNETSERHPLLIFLPGGGQYGNGALDLPLLLKDGPAQLADEKRFPGTFKVNDKVYSFIVFTPQFKRYPNLKEIEDCIEFAKRTFRVDTTRVYLSGLSMGGVETTNFAAQSPHKLAAIVPMAGMSYDTSTTDKCRTIAAAALPLWAFHSADDASINIKSTKDFIFKLNAYSPTIPGRLTIWPDGGHDAWTRAIDPAYRENGMNIYEWMLQYKR